MDRFWETVRSSSYYRDVLKNMVGPSRGTIVRFGTEGEGIAPNYEIEHPNGRKVAFRGLSHKENTETPVYAADHLSQPYGYADVQALLAKCMDQRH